MLHRRHAEYINEDELAKKFVWENTIKWVNKIHPEKEVSIKSNAEISDTQQYQFDVLFESWRSSIEELLNASYNNKITHEKSFEIIKKYNIIVSFLKNSMSLNKLSLDDQEKIKSKFADMREKLIEVKNIMEDNADSNFSERDDIIKMVDDINSSSTIERKPYSEINAKGESMVKSIRDKRTAQEKIVDASVKISDIEKLVSSNPFIKNDQQIMQNFNEIDKFYSEINPKQMTRDEIELVDANFSNIDIIDNQIKDEIKYHKELETNMTEIKKNIDEIEKKLDSSVVEKYIKDNSKLTDDDTNQLLDDVKERLNRLDEDQVVKEYMKIRDEDFDDLYQIDKGESAYTTLKDYLQNVETFYKTLFTDIDNALGTATIHTPATTTTTTTTPVKKKKPPTVQAPPSVAVKTTRKIHKTPEAFNAAFKEAVQDNIRYRATNHTNKYNNPIITAYKQGLTRKSYQPAWIKYVNSSDDDKRKFFE